jgi:hypothetical protein
MLQAAHPSRSQEKGRKLNAQWNTGWLIAMIALIALAVIAWLLVIGCGFWYFTGARDYRKHSSTLSGPIALGALCAALVIGGIGTYVAFPFSAAYHRYAPVTGTVTVTESRFLGSGNSTTQNYLIGINGKDYRCDDTRCSQLEKGDVVTLLCEKSFQFNGVSGSVCNWGKLDHVKG